MSHIVNFHKPGVFFAFVIAIDLFLTLPTSSSLASPSTYIHGTKLEPSPNLTKLFLVNNNNHNYIGGYTHSKRWSLRGKNRTERRSTKGQDVPPQAQTADFLFSNPLNRRTKSNNNGISKSGSNMKKRRRRGGNNKLNSEPPSQLSWQSWMSRGTPRYRGVEEVTMRDPIELGGVPRNNQYAANDWLHNTINLPNSAILKSILYPVLSISIWASLISALQLLLVRRGKVALAEMMCIPVTPHSLMVSALGLLLVFRTNSAYQRFAEGRKIWGDILSEARDLYRLGKLYENQIGVAKFRRVQRLLAAFPYLLRFRIRPSSVNMHRIDDKSVVRDREFSLILYQDHASTDNDAEAALLASDEENTGMSRRKPRELYWVDRRTLPWRLLPSDAREDCVRAQNRPLWVCDRMAAELHAVPDSPKFTNRERLTLVAKVEKLSQAIGACERIHQTVVPLNYARHALRCLTMWLISLPFALVQNLGLMTGPVLFVMSWMLFGVYEIGYSIEDPFQGTLRLSILCDAIRRDVMEEELVRNTAFRLSEDTIPLSKIKEPEGRGKRKAAVVVAVEDEGKDYDDVYDEDDNFYDVKVDDIIIDAIGNIVLGDNVVATKKDDSASVLAHVNGSKNTVGVMLP